MKYNYHIAIMAILLTSCIKEEPKNMECDILEAWVEGDDLARHFSQTTDMRISDPMPIYFKLTSGATISPANGSAQDFSKGPVAYTVTSEDGQWHRTYTIEFRETVLPSSRYDFEDYELSSDGKYYSWYNQADDGTRDKIWASGNEGFMIAKPNAVAADYPTVPDENGFEGYCVRLITRSTGSWGKTFKKPIAAGNLFLGTFDSQFALTNTLRTTNMGIVFTREPVKVTGYYKYQPGEVFTDKDFKEVSSRTDIPAIHAEFYLNHDEQGREVRMAEVASLPPTNEWQPFEMTFEGSTPIDAELLANRGYNLSLVFSSSKTGDTFEGAVGSTLWIDNVEITFVEK